MRSSSTASIHSKLLPKVNISLYPDGIGFMGYSVRLSNISCNNFKNNVFALSLACLSVVGADECKENYFPSYLRRSFCVEDPHANKIFMYLNETEAPELEILIDEYTQSTATSTTSSMLVPLEVCYEINGPGPLCNLKTVIEYGERIAEFVYFKGIKAFHLNRPDLSSIERFLTAINDTMNPQVATLSPAHTTPPAPIATTVPPASHHSGLNFSTIIGIVFGGMALCTMALILLWYSLQNRADDAEQQPLLQGPPAVPPAAPINPAPAVVVALAPAPLMAGAPVIAPALIEALEQKSLPRNAPRPM